MNFLKKRSSTKERTEYGPDNAYKINMNNGNINNNNKNNNNYVRCVLEHEFTFPELYKAYTDCRKRKRNTINALKFEVNLESNLEELLISLNNKTYKPTRSVCFSITDPKPREVFAADFKDRVIHHLLYNHLNPIYEKIFIYDSFACRKDKGTLRAVQRLQSFTRKITNNSKDKVYYLQLDIHNFFMSIDKEILFNILNKKIKDKNISWLTKEIIFHNPTKDYLQKGLTYKQAKVPEHKTLFNVKENKGLPIGNLTSQFFANVYLNHLDQYIKHKLKIKHYVRYVDDFVILSKSRKELLLLKKETEQFLEKELKLKLKPLIIIKPISSGINFVGYIIKPNYLLPRNRVINNLKNKIKIFKKKNINFLGNIKIIDFKHTPKIINSINSYLGYLKYTKNKKILIKLKQDNSFLKDFLIFEKNKVIGRYFNKINNFQKQYHFFKNNQENTIVFLDVIRYYRVLEKDAQFLNKKCRVTLNKTKNYVFVNLLKSKVIIDKLLNTGKKIILTEQIKNASFNFRKITKIYSLS